MRVVVALVLGGLGVAFVEAGANGSALKLFSAFFGKGPQPAASAPLPNSSTISPSVVGGGSTFLPYLPGAASSNPSPAPYLTPGGGGLSNQGGVILGAFQQPYPAGALV